MSELNITFLGTSSGRPTLRRNVAAIYLQYGGESILLDCGEGTQMQMLKSEVKPGKLVAVMITHFHGDHINGLPGLLGTLGLNGREEELTVVGPSGINQYFETLHDLLILRPRFRLNVRDNDLPVVFETNEFYVESVRLRHGIPCHGFIFRERDRTGRFDVQRARELGVTPGPDFGKLQRGQTLTLDDGRLVTPQDVLGPSRPGRSIAYISDTRPSPKVIDAIRGVDILIHEATYLDELRDQAKQRKHSTVLEAARVASEAGVGQLILTHISPKHGSRREILKEARRAFSNVELAEDFDTYSLPMRE